MAFYLNVTSELRSKSLNVPPMDDIFVAEERLVQLKTICLALSYEVPVYVGRNRRSFSP